MLQMVYMKDKVNMYSIDTGTTLWLFESVILGLKGLLT